MPDTIQRIRERWANTSDKQSKFGPTPWTDYLPFEADSGGARYCQGCYIIRWDDVDNDRPAIEHAPTDIATLLAHLERYGGHRRTANDCCNIFLSGTKGCTCGWDQISKSPGATE